MKTADPRVPDMLAMRLRGETLRAIGAKYGVTRERARQVLQMTTAPDGTGAFAIRAAQKAAVLDAEVAAVAGFLEANPGATPDQVAEGVGVGAGTVGALARTAGLTGLLREQATAYEDRAFAFTDAQLLGALRAAAANLPAGERLTALQYTAMRPTLACAPSVPLLFDRFGSWIGACTRAGVVPGSPNRAYEKGFDDDAILDGLAEFLTVSRSVSVVAYDRWRAGRTPAVACSSAIRKRYGTWVAARGHAQDRMDARRTAAAA